MENGIKEMSLCTIFILQKNRYAIFISEKIFLKKMQRLYNGLVFAGALNFE